MKITLRELFLLMLAVALSLGWWLDRRQLAAETEVRRKTSDWEKARLARDFENLLREDGYTVRWQKGKITVMSPSGRERLCLWTPGIGG